MIGLLQWVGPIILTNINIAGMRSGKAYPVDHVNNSADRNTYHTDFSFQRGSQGFRGIIKVFQSNSHVREVPAWVYISLLV